MLRFVLAVLALLAAPAQADEPLVKLQTGDAGRDWMAVGKLVMGDAEFCTGALVAPDLVLTAAHCLFDKTTGQPFAPAQITFLDGWRNGRAEAYRSARAAVAFPGYVFGDPNQPDRVARDLALIALDQPIRLPQVRPFAMTAAPGPGAQVSVVSYAQDRAEAPSLQSVCHVLNRQDQILILTCDVDFGSSGAPVFIAGPDGAQIVSVISAKAEADGQKVALASAAPEALTVLVEALDEVLPRRGTAKVLMGGGALSAGGAKMLKVGTPSP